MRFLFFLLLKLIEVVGVLVVISMGVVVLHFCPIFIVWLERIFIYGILFLCLSGFVYFNWQMAGEWADKWRKKKQKRTP